MKSDWGGYSTKRCYSRRFFLSFSFSLAPERRISFTPLSVVSFFVSMNKFRISELRTEIMYLEYRIESVCYFFGFAVSLRILKLFPLLNNHARMPNHFSLS